MSVAVILCCLIAATTPSSYLLVIRGPETDRVPVGVGNRSQKPNRTFAVQCRNVRDGDLISGAERIRSGFADPEPRELRDAAADDRPLGYRAIRVLDVEFQHRMGIDKPECLERSSHLRFLSQRVHAREGMMRVQTSTGQERAAQDDASQSPLSHLHILLKS